MGTNRVAYFKGSYDERSTSIGLSDRDLGGREEKNVQLCQIIDNNRSSICLLRILTRKIDHPSLVQGDL